MVRLRLEYGDEIWGPHYNGDQVIVEKVQKRATKLVSSIWHLPYEQKVLKLPSLMHRRRRGDMLETYKVVTNKPNVDKSHFFEFSFAPTRGHQYQLRRLKSTKLARIQNFSQRVVTDWNSLPKELVQARML